MSFRFDEPLKYGTCRSLADARTAADEARREDLLGKFPAACVVLDMQVSRVNAALRDLLASWDDESEVSVHERVRQLRDFVTPNV